MTEINKAIGIMSKSNGHIQLKKVSAIKYQFVPDSEKKIELGFSIKSIQTIIIEIIKLNKIDSISAVLI